MREKRGVYIFYLTYFSCYSAFVPVHAFSVFVTQAELKKTYNISVLDIPKTSDTFARTGYQQYEGRFRKEHRGYFIKR
jgi:hypothetical protein